MRIDTRRRGRQCLPEEALRIGKMAAPEVAKTAAAMAGKAVVLKVDTESHPELAERYGVRGIPNFAVFRGGRLVFQQPGLVPSATMQSWLETV